MSNDLQAKWKEINTELRLSSALQQSVLELVETKQGAETLEKARQKWLEQGFEESPFEFVFIRQREKEQQRKQQEQEQQEQQEQQQES